MMNVQNYMGGQGVMPQGAQGMMPQGGQGPPGPGFNTPPPPRQAGGQAGGPPSPPFGGAMPASVNYRGRDIPTGQGGGDDINSLRMRLAGMQGQNVPPWVRAQLEQQLSQMMQAEAIGGASDFAEWNLGQRTGPSLGGGPSGPDPFLSQLMQLQLMGGGMGGGAMSSGRN